MNDLEQLIISQMKDIRSVHEVSAFPIGFGWWVVLAFAIFIVIVNIYVGIQKAKRRRSWKFMVENELEKVEKALPDTSMKEILGYLNEILKRIAIQYYGRKEAAALEGRTWLEWLNARDPDGFDWIKKGVVLVDFPYMEPEKISVKKKDILHIIRAIKPWLK